LLSKPAQGCPAFNAVNFATVDETFIPAEFGFATISRVGFASFSKVVHVKAAPFPELSKLMGDFCAERRVTAAIITAEKMTVFIVFISLMARPFKRR
jgi:hypothetical protein